jgi:hypothetical protein
VRGTTGNEHGGTDYKSARAAVFIDFNESSIDFNESSIDFNESFIDFNESSIDFNESFIAFNETPVRRSVPLRRTGEKKVSQRRKFPSQRVKKVSQRGNFLSQRGKKGLNLILRCYCFRLRRSDDGYTERKGCQAARREPSTARADLQSVR